MDDNKLESVSEFIRAEAQRLGTPTMAPGSEAFKAFQNDISKRIFTDEKFVSSVERYYGRKEEFSQLNSAALERAGEVDAWRLAHPVRTALHLQGRISTTLTKIEEQATAAFRLADASELHKGIAWDAVKSQVTRLVVDSLPKIALTTPSAQTAAQGPSVQIKQDLSLEQPRSIASGMSM